jgi:nucleotide-binding universal stress UspA family protein
MYEADLLKLHVKAGRGHLQIIAERARLEGIETKEIVQIGRFAAVCLDLVEREKPSLILTTLSHRPEWVRTFFGAPVNELIEKTGCPVMVV